MEGLSHYIIVGLNFLKSAAAHIDFQSNCLRSDVYRLNAHLGKRDLKMFELFKNPQKYVLPWNLSQRRYGGLDKQEVVE